MNIGEKVIVCDKCSAEFFVKSVKIEKCSVEMNGKTLFLNYFVCPKCNQIYKVLLVEEQKYYELINDLLLIEKRMQKLNGKLNVQMLERLQKIAQIKKDKIKSYVNKMNHKYDGTFTFATSKNNQKEIIYHENKHGNLKGERRNG